MSSKPREFWISPGVEVWQSDEVVMNPKCKKDHHIHVVEITALREAERMIEILSSALAKIQAQTELFNFAKDPIRVHTANDCAIEAIKKLAEYRKSGSENG